MLKRIEAISEACANCAALVARDHDSSALGRREFISASVMAAAAAALAACSGAASDGVTAPGSVGLTLTVSDYPALATVGGVALVTASGSPLAVVRTGAAAFVALSRICPHQGSTVNSTNGGFLCPNHGARFNLNGTWISGQKTSNMRSYSTGYDAATGTLTIG